MIHMYISDLQLESSEKPDCHDLGILKEKISHFYVNSDD